MNETQWYYSEGDQQRGPVSWEQLQQLAVSGRLTADDLVWNQGMAEWATAGAVPDLIPAPAAPPVVPSRPAGPPKPAKKEPDLASAASDAAAAGAKAVQEGARRASKMVAAGASNLKRSFGAAVAATLSDAMTALRALVRHPILLSLVTLTFLIAASLSLSLVITAVLFPMFVMGYLTVIRQTLAKQPLELAAFIGFMRHGWNSLWHLFMMLASFVVTFSLMMAPLVLLLLVLYFAGGTLAAFYGTVTGGQQAADSGSPAGAAPRAARPAPAAGPQQAKSDEGVFATLWNMVKQFVWRVILLVVITLTLFPMCSAMILFFNLILDVSGKEPDSTTGFNLVYESFQKMLEMGQTHWKEVATDGLFIATIFGISVFVIGLVTAMLASMKLFALAGWIAGVVAPICWLVFLVYAVIFTAMVCLKFRERTEAMR